MPITDTGNGIIIDYNPDDGIVELFIGPLSQAQQMATMPQMVIDSSNRKIYVMDGIVAQMIGNPAQHFYRAAGPDNAEWGDEQQALAENKSVGGPRFEAIVNTPSGLNNIRIAEVYSRLRSGQRGSLHLAVKTGSGDTVDALVIHEDGSVTDGDGNPFGGGVQGPQGPIGPQGPVGARGQIGARGPQGEAGERGARGPEGARGEAGPAGPQGEKGDTGRRGPGCSRKWKKGIEARLDALEEK